MFDIFTYFIYISLLVSLMALTSSNKIGRNNFFDFQKFGKLEVRHFVALLLISIVVGFRYEVGVDWLGYKLEFENIKQNTAIEFSQQHMEFAFFYINKIIANLGLSYEWMFFTIALITWYFFFKSVPLFILPLFIFFVFVDEYFFWGMNGVRQFTAMSIWLVSIRFIVDRKPFHFFALIIIASLFHRSVLLLIPTYFFIKIPPIRGKWLVLVFMISLVVGSTPFFIQGIEAALSKLGETFQIFNTYTGYIKSESLFIDEELKLGPGFFFRIAVNFLILVLSSKVLRKYPNCTIYFVLFFIGAILFNLTFKIQLMGRINNYFLIIRSIVLAILVVYYWRIEKYNKKYNRLLVIVLMVSYFILFLRAIYVSSNMCSPFQFSG